MPEGELQPIPFQPVPTNLGIEGEGDFIRFMFATPLGLSVYFLPKSVGPQMRSLIEKAESSLIVPNGGLEVPTPVAPV